MKIKWTSLFLLLFLAGLRTECIGQTPANDPDKTEETQSKDKKKQEKRDKKANDEKKDQNQSKDNDKIRTSKFPKLASALLLTDESFALAKKNHSFFERLFASDEDILRQERIDSLDAMIQRKDQQIQDLQKQLKDVQDELSREKDSAKDNKKKQDAEKELDKSTCVFGETRWSKTYLMKERLNDNNVIMACGSDDKTTWLQYFKERIPAYVELEIDGQKAFAYNYWAITSPLLAPKG
ncbi:MAG: hypothetical protein ACKOZY_08665, partial [Flavobacteriales bacterium]